jgi:3-hydroxyisobutyrate dehydrogenase-like beta-hydroxyacid dehydrogenase
VFGRPEAAEARTLKVVAAGAKEAVERARPVLDAVAERAFVLGDDPTQANVVKLCGNFMIATMIETLGETFAMARKSGVAPDAFLEVLNGTFFGSPIFSGYAQRIAAGEYQPAAFTMSLGLKDLRLLLDAAGEVSVPMPIASLVRDRLLTGVATGHGDDDWSTTALLAAQSAGLHS